MDKKLFLDMTEILSRSVKNIQNGKQMKRQILYHVLELHSSLGISSDVFGLVKFNYDAIRFDVYKREYKAAVGHWHEEMEVGVLNYQFKPFATVRVFDDSGKVNVDCHITDKKVYEDLIRDYYQAAIDFGLSKVTEVSTTTDFNNRH